MSRTRFRVWAPFCQNVDVKIRGRKKPDVYRLSPEKEGYFSTTIPEIKPGTRYTFILDGKKERPDPASRYQPLGVHGPSETVDQSAFKWKDTDWKGVPQRELVFYECHIGTFTPGGTFEAAIQKIPYLKKLGVNCLEIMPVAQFPGKRNWGYDGAALYAPQNSYGGPEGLKKLVQACHASGLAVCLDVVYNHLGPEGNYLNDFGPFFTGRYKTPWGKAVNFDGPSSKPVRTFFVQNALYWLKEFHIDALRLDAVHAIFDSSSKHILREIKEEVQKLSRKSGRPLYVIAESDLNDSILIRPQKNKGYGLDAQWCDDFHHALHTVLTEEQNGYYLDYGRVKDLAKSLQKGYVYDGIYSKYRKRRFGNSTKRLASEKFIVCAQNHDQVGNRAFGERLSTLVSFKEQKIAAALVLLSPYLPLLFMGEEYGEEAPFQYFVDHSDSKLIKAVRKGRSREFKSFGTFQSKTIPDPQSPKTFNRSKLRPGRLKARQQQLFLLHKDLIKRRPGLKIERSGNKTKIRFNEKEKWLTVRYRAPAVRKLFLVVNFSGNLQEVPFSFKNSLKELLHTEEKKYGGNLSKKTARLNKELIILPQSAALYEEL